jgi:dienelactone hydrolase
LRSLLVLVVSLLLALPAAASDPFWPTEAIQVPSRTFSDEQFLLGEAGTGDPVTLKGSLALAPEGAGHAVVILLHGTDGPSSNAVNAWRSFLNGAGYGTVRLDSYGGRGLTQASTDQAAISQFAQVYDAFRLIEVLAEHERIDPNRVVLMGFSRGGTAALYASLARFHELYGPKTDSIAAYLPFYPSCNFELADGFRMAGSPLRAFHGGADDWTSPEVCASYVEQLAMHGGDAAITLYPGARHAFDSPVPRFTLTLEDAQRSFNCMRIEEDGVLLNHDTGEPFSYSDACVTTGPTVAADDAATQQAQQAVLALLAETVGAP